MNASVSKTMSGSTDCPSTWQLFWVTHLFGVVVCVLIVAPTSALLFGGHLPMALFVLPLPFPCALFIYFNVYRDIPSSQRRRFAGRAIGSLAIYAVLTLVACSLSPRSHPSRAEVLGLLDTWGFFFFPFNLVAYL